MILSFAWTNDVLLSGKKTCSRRRWSAHTAKAWINAYRSGRHIHQAWDKAPFYPEAKKVADIRLLCQPCQDIRCKDA